MKWSFVITGCLNYPNGSRKWSFINFRRADASNSKDKCLHYMKWQCSSYTEVSKWVSKNVPPTTLGSFLTLIRKCYVSFNPNCLINFKRFNFIRPFWMMKSRYSFILTNHMQCLKKINIQDDSKKLFFHENDRFRWNFHRCLTIFFSE